MRVRHWSNLRHRLGLEIFEYADSADAAIFRAAELEPRLVALDFGLPDMNGLEATRHVMECAPGA